MIRRVVLEAVPVLLTALPVFFGVLDVFATVDFLPQLQLIKFVYCVVIIRIILRRLRFFTVLRFLCV